VALEKEVQMHRLLITTIGLFFAGVSFAQTDENISVTNGVFCSSEEHVRALLENIHSPGLEGLFKGVDATNGEQNDGSVCNLYNLPVIVEGESTTIGEGTYLGEKVPIVKMQVPRVFLPSLNGAGLLLRLDKPFEAYTFRSKKIYDDPTSKKT